MTKTTIYLEDSMLRQLKVSAAAGRKTNVADLIRQAVGDFLNKRRKPKKAFQNLQQLLKAKPRKTTFGDAVAFQKSMRSEWDD